MQFVLDREISSGLALDFCVGPGRACWHVRQFGWGPSVCAPLGLLTCQVSFRGLSSGLDLFFRCWVHSRYGYRVKCFPWARKAPL